MFIQNQEQFKNVKNSKSKVKNAKNNTQTRVVFLGVSWFTAASVRTIVVKTIRIRRVAGVLSQCTLVNIFKKELITRERYSHGSSQ